MSTHTTLEDVIRQYVHFPRPPNGRGWVSCVHTACDHGRKGPRAVFRFEPGGDVRFRCLNCGMSGAYSPDRGWQLSDKMKAVFASFGIPNEDWRPVLFQHQRSAKARGEASSVATPGTAPTIALPTCAIPLADAKDTTIGVVAHDYLINRGMDPTAHPFYVTQPPGKTAGKLHRKLYGRVIIPMYHNQRLVFWQARDLTGLRAQKYMSPSVDRGSVLGNYNSLNNNDPGAPIYITEGWFDAQLLNGVCVFGNIISPAQLQMLSRHPRPKVLVPDANSSGKALARIALDNGWSVAPIRVPGIVDVTDLVQKYGKLYALDYIRAHTVTGAAGRIAVELACNSTKSP